MVWYDGWGFFVVYQQTAEFVSEEIRVYPGWRRSTHGVQYEDASNVMYIVVGQNAGIGFESFIEDVPTNKNKTA